MKTQFQKKKKKWNFERYLNDALSVKNESRHQDWIYKMHAFFNFELLIMIGS